MSDDHEKKFESTNEGTKMETIIKKEEKFDILEHIKKEECDLVGIKSEENQGTQENIVLYPCEECCFNADSPTQLKRLKLSHKKACHASKDNYKSCMNPGKFTCEICNFSTKTKVNLERHMISQHQDQAYPCKECNYIGNCKQNLSRHTKKMHTSVFKCDECDKTFHSEFFRNKHKKTHVFQTCEHCDFKSKETKSLRIHVESQHLGIRYPCDLCDYLAPNVYRLNHHKRVKHEGFRFQCDQCDFKAISSDTLSRHKERDHNRKVFRCEQCSFKTTLLHYLKQHKKRQHSDESHPCDKCDYIGTCSQNLKRHIDNLHTSVLVCEECEKTFHNEFWLNKHKKTHLIQECEHCDFKTKETKTLRIHTESQHLGIRYPCDLCDYSASNVYKLNLHKRVKHEGFRFECNQCEFKAISSDVLSKHKRSKHVKKVFSCEQCSFKTTLARYLIIHVKTQHNDDKYPCDQCSYIGNCNMNLNRHMKKMHSSVLSCDECDKTFHSKVLFNKHKNVHKRFNCEVCGYETGQSKSFKRHVASIHEKTNYICCICKYPSKTLSELDEHRLKKHGGACTCTESKLENRSQLFDHASLSYPCDLCNNQTTSFDDLIGHMKAKHKKTVQCNQCDYSSYAETYLKRHMKTIHRSVFHCFECDFKTGNQDLMDKHLKEEHSQSET